MDKFNYDTIDWKVPLERSLLINKDIDNSSLRLYLILLSYARDKVTAFPSRETLAKDMGCSIRTIDNLKNKLKKVGLLDWKTYYNGNNKHNAYRLLCYKPINRNNDSLSNQINDVYYSIDEKTKELKIDETIKETIETFVKSYKSFCENSENISGYITSGWNKNSNYIPSKGDIKNLYWYKHKYGEEGLIKLKNSFKFLESYIREEIEFGNFYSKKGAELIPTISLFIKAKTQHDKLMQFALDKMEQMEDNN